MKVASFNVQKFGERKLTNRLVRETLIKIVSRYDIIVILEVVDSSRESVETFLRELNQFYSTINYKMVISTRLGRGQYKEQFMFLYREKVVGLVGSYQYEDSQPGDKDAFAREPYVLRFKCRTTVLEDLVLIPVHTKPDDTEKEIDELYDVFTAVKKKWKTKNIMILGDFNADGKYLSEAAKKKNRIWGKNFHWLIEDDVDTTASNNNEYTYDRIVVYGDDMLNAVVPDSAKSFNFQEAYKLTDEALKVSDHYPVEVKLKRKRIMKVASFNIQRFGREKLSDPFVLQTLIEIVSRYDIIVILEVVDSEGISANRFLEKLNEFNNDSKYKMVISPRLGRGRYKEQFMFLYRDKEVALNGSYQYNDSQPGNEDAFAREPYAVRFNCHNTVLKDLVLIPVHTNPKDAKKELEDLYNVFLAVKEEFHTNNIMILGDFNADGRSLSEEDKRKLRICGTDFHWLITDDMDTTTSNNNDNTYDRIVVYGDDMLKAVVQDSAKPFDFQTKHKLKDEDAKRVSDHYPVEVELM